MNYIFLFSYLVEGGSANTCVVRMTKFYFEKLGAGYCGSVVPLCAPFDYHSPGKRVQNYSGALQDFHYVLDLIGERAKGIFPCFPSKYCLCFLKPFPFFMVHRTLYETRWRF